MARKRALAAEQEQQPDTSFNPSEFDPEMKQDSSAAAQQVTAEPTEEQNGNGQSFAEKVGKREYKPAPDPFGVENIKGEGNRVRLLKSTADRAWVIRFEKNPNEMEGYSKENPHPVLKMLKEEGYRWGFDSNDGKGGWGKNWQEGHYTYTEHMDARRVLAKAAEMIGAKVEQGVSI